MHRGQCLYAMTSNADLDPIDPRHGHLVSSHTPAHSVGAKGASCSRRRPIGESNYASRPRSNNKAGLTDFLFIFSNATCLSAQLYAPYSFFNFVEADCHFCFHVNTSAALAKSKNRGARLLAAVQSSAPCNFSS